jgi:hypothetical protein
MMNAIKMTVISEATTARKTTGMVRTGNEAAEIVNAAVAMTMKAATTMT